jgi:hypothetical protein
LRLSQVMNGNQDWGQVGISSAPTVMCYHLIEPPERKWALLRGKQRSSKTAESRAADRAMLDSINVPYGG